MPSAVAPAWAPPIGGAARRGPPPAPPRPRRGPPRAPPGGGGGAGRAGAPPRGPRRSAGRRPGHLLRPLRPWSGPSQRPTSPGVQQADGEDAEEDTHLRDRRPAELLDDRRPGEEEDGVDREQHVEEGVQVVPDLRLRPAAAD